MIFAAMTQGHIEEFLSGERDIYEPYDIPEDVQEMKMSDL